MTSPITISARTVRTARNEERAVRHQQVGLERGGTGSVSTVPGSCTRNALICRDEVRHIAQLDAGCREGADERICDILVRPTVRVPVACSHAVVERIWSAS